MSVEFSRAIITLINFVLLIGVIFIIVWFIKTFTHISKSNKNIEDKLDKLIEFLNKKDSK